VEAARQRRQDHPEVLQSLRPVSQGRLHSRLQSDPFSRARGEFFETRVGAN
jgi:hypothetical protein